MTKQYFYNELDSFMKRGIDWLEFDPPSLEKISEVKLFIEKFDSIPYFISPGYSGEILLEYRNSRYEIEIYFIDDYVEDGIKNLHTLIYDMSKKSLDNDYIIYEGDFDEMIFNKYV